MTDEHKSLINTINRLYIRKADLRQLRADLNKKINQLDIRVRDRVGTEETQWRNYAKLVAYTEVRDRLNNLIDGDNSE